MLGLIREGKDCILKELHELASVYRQEFGGYPWDRISGVFDPGDQNVRRNKQEFIDLRPFSWDMGFNALPGSPGGGANSLLRSLLEALGKDWPMVRQSRSTELLW